ncbi:hypothetical protein C1H46_031463 [Malus baccata]|uniref:Protein DETOXIFICATION n=1 Tax=Malus baccata TaxID=106549 RepID=A0A540L8Y8_MALBA|nr:hypothetical protein C1H46_031463 [Malus baccata]
MEEPLLDPATRGHLGTIELSAISISLSVISTFTYGFMLGMGSALETLCGQAFGAGQVHMLGIYMQRSYIILFVTAFLLLPTYIFATPILKWLGQEDDIANEAGKFTLQIIPQLSSLAINFPAQKFLQAQRKVKVLAWIAVLALLMHIGMLALFIVRVSNELGLRRPRTVKYAVYVTVSQSLLLGLLFMIIILITKDDFAVIFTSDKELQQEVAKLAYLLGITMVLNSVQPVISGVAIGGGWQATVAYINLGCYHIFGLSLGYVLCHVANLGVTGLLGGMICGTALQTILLLIILYKTNWNNEVEKATNRVRKWGGQDIKTANGAEST